MINKCKFISLFFFIGSIHAESITFNYIKNRHLSTLALAPTVTPPCAAAKKPFLEKLKKFYFPNYRSMLVQNIPTGAAAPSLAYFTIPLMYEKLNSIKIFNTDSEQNSLCTLDTLSLDSLELLSNNNKDNSSKSLIKKIGYDNNLTTCGRIYFNQLIVQPITNIQVLQKRQCAIQCMLHHFLNKNKNFNELTSILKSIASTELDLLLFFTPEKENILTQIQLKNNFFNYEMPTLKYLNKLNTLTTYQELIHGFKCADVGFYSYAGTPVSQFFTKEALVFLSLVTAFKGINPVINSLKFSFSSKYEQVATQLKWINERTQSSAKIPLGYSIDMPLSFPHISQSTAYMVEGLWAAYSFYSFAYGAAKLTQDISFYSYLQERTTSVATLVKAIQIIDKLLDQHPDLNIFDDATRATLKLDIDKTESQLRTLVELLNTDTFKTETNITSIRQGRAAAAFAMLQEMASDLVPALYAIGQLDTLHAFAQYMTETGTEHFCVATFKEQTTPYIDAHDIWNPFLNINQAIKNSITLGSVNPDIAHPQNIVLSGPNAGGKSTFLRSLTFATIMAQTFGIAPAASFTLTPFAHIFSTINITDNIASGDSKFAAEVKRANELAQKLKTLPTNNFCLAILDELFVGTDPKIAEDLSYQTAMHYGLHPHCMVLFATHYEKNKTLEETTNVFKNYYVEILRNTKDDSFTRTFKIKPGTTTENVAVEMVKQSGLLSF